MTTITFEEEIKLTRNNFKNVKDFFIYTIENYDIENDKVEFWILEDSEISQDLLEKIKKAKSSKIHFNNI